MFVHWTISFELMRMVLNAGMTSLPIRTPGFLKTELGAHGCMVQKKVHDLPRGSGHASSHENKLLLF
jgi:hypothetical protein